MHSPPAISIRRSESVRHWPRRLLCLKRFRGNVANCLIAYDMATRLSANPLMVMQSIYIVHGKPSWSSSFICGMINSCGRFEPLQFKMSGKGDGRACVAYTQTKNGGQRLEGPAASIEMAKAEGWFSKNGSKWKTMPEIMLRYRAATFFGRLYAPELLLGMKSIEEVADSDSGPRPQAENVKFGGDPDPSEDDTNPELMPTSEAVAAEPEPAASSSKPDAPKSPQDQLAEFVQAAGFDIELFNRWAVDAGHLPTEVSTWDEVGPALVKRLMRIKATILRGLAEIKNGGAS